MAPRLPTAHDTPLSRASSAADLDSSVHSLLHARAHAQAQDLFERTWQQTTLPHLPLRYAFRLERLDSDGVGKMVARARNGGNVLMHLESGLDPRDKDAIAVVLTDGRLVVGFLAEDAREVLSRAAEYASLYLPKPLSIDGLSTGQPVMYMELVRPDVRQCSACGTLHTGDKENCDDCRSKRRRKKMTLEETQERPSIALNAAFRRISVYREDAVVVTQALDIDDM